MKEFFSSLYSLGLSGLLLAAGGGCRAPQPLPPADFRAPGWHVLNGQAVWSPPAHRPELAGDLLLATNVNGDCFVQFTKTPFPLVTATVRGERWQIEFGAHEHVWHGRGTPPERFVWFQLPRLLAGGKTGGDWHFTPAVTPDIWRLENLRTGEALEGGTFP